MEKKGDGKELEKKAKEFFNQIIIRNFRGGFNPVQIENFDEHAEKVNYLIEKKYLEEGKSLFSREETVKSIRYIPTYEGKTWAKS
jgi:hypothetical protein